MAYKRFHPTRNRHYCRLRDESQRRRGGPRRKYRKKRPTYRKKGAMSKKRILNITSRKKRDTMLPWSNVTASSQSGSTIYNPYAAQLIGGTSVVPMFIWSPTARDLNKNSGAGSVIDMASRSASLCYMRGIKESVEIQVVNGLPWQWRRIIFTAKGIQDLIPNTPSFQPYHETSYGMMRSLNQPPTATRNNIETLIFKGAANTDWNDVIVAPLDRSRVTVRYDKVITLASGNDDGVMRRYNRWHPFNKNLRYDDDEAGDSMATNNWSVTGKEGMGDVYIVDYFRPRVGSTADDILYFGPNATLYWHER
uniref:Capsid protein n=1 Tax=Genomoviridae sp. TaxID=2202565 RepID=A0A858NE59_9VIRU|nr:MAG: capsid protein [Genomoviridae sp.]